MQSYDQLSRRALSPQTDTGRKAVASTDKSAEYVGLARASDFAVNVESDVVHELTARADNSATGPNASQSWARSAISWLLTAIVESFAAYAMSMYPGLIDPNHGTDHPQTKEQRRQAAPKQRKNPAFFPVSAAIDIWPLEKAERSTKARHGFLGWCARFGSAHLPVWPRLRRLRERKTPVAKSVVLETRLSEEDDFDWCHFDNPTKPGHPFGW